MSNLNHETVTSVHHWTDTLFSFTTTRDPGFRFENGQFAMIGIEVDGKPLLRAYSVVSANWEEHLEFLSIKVPDGPLTSRLQHIQVGDTLLVGRKPTGTLLLRNLTPGKRLWLLGTGTGLAPFMCLARDPEAYEQYEQIILVHGCRWVRELAYRDYLTKELPEHEFLGEMVRDKLVYYPTITREPFENQGRINDLIETNGLTQKLGLPDLNVEEDRIMLCGSPAMITDVRRLLTERGFDEGNMNHPGAFVVERAFVGEG